KRRIDQERDAPLRERTDLGDGEREYVGDDGDRLAVEVAAGKNFISQYQRVVRDRSRFSFEHARGMTQLVEACAHHLRLAAQAVRVLHARIVLQVRAANLAAIQQREV